MTAPTQNRTVLLDALRIGSRYIVAAALFHSGVRMAFNLAGIHAGPVEWITPLGDLTGAQYAGIWLGHSTIFQVLGGLVQIAASLLLLSRKTTTLGAMIAVGCFTNSLMLHICFRPSPWIGDALFLALSAFLVLLDRRLLIDLFLLDRATTPIPTEPTWESPQTRRIGLALKSAVLVYFVYAIGLGMFRLKQDANAQSDWSGTYSVASFSPANADLQHRWRAAAIDRYAERLTVRTMDGNGITYEIQPVSAEASAAYPRTSHREHVAEMAAPQGQLALVAPDRSSTVLSYSRTPSGRLTLKGRLNGVATTADLQPASTANLPLLNRDVYYPEPR